MSVKYVYHEVILMVCVYNRLFIYVFLFLNI